MIKPSKRGRSLTTKTLAQLVYRKSVLKNTMRVRASVLDNVFGKCGTREATLLKKRFGQSLTSFQIGRGRDNKGHRAVRRRWGQRSTQGRSKRGCDVFHSEHFVEQLAGFTLGEKRRRIMAQWRNLPREEQQVYEARANAHNESKVPADTMNFRDLAQGGDKRTAMEKSTPANNSPQHAIEAKPNPGAIQKRAPGSRVGGISAPGAVGKRARALVF